MVSTCVNPVCNAKFTYFGTGELLVKVSPRTGRQELFWICQRCATEWQMPEELVPIDVNNVENRARLARKLTAA